MSLTEKKEIAVVGDINTSIGFKLAGLKRVYALEENVEDKEINRLLTELRNDQNIGIIVLTDNFSSRVESPARDEGAIPITVEIPKLQRPIFPDSREYYRREVTNILGFSIEL